MYFIKIKIKKIFQLLISFPSIHDSNLGGAVPTLLLSLKLKKVGKAAQRLGLFLLHTEDLGSSLEAYVSSSPSIPVVVLNVPPNKMSPSPQKDCPKS